jgi:hypothetical protein
VRLYSYICIDDLYCARTPAFTAITPALAGCRGLNSRCYHGSAPWIVFAAIDQHFTDNAAIAFDLRVVNAKARTTPPSVRSTDRPHASADHVSEHVPSTDRVTGCRRVTTSGSSASSLGPIVYASMASRRCTDSRPAAMPSSWGMASLDVVDFVVPVIRHPRLLPRHPHRRGSPRPRKVFVTQPGSSSSTSRTANTHL